MEARQNLLCFRLACGDQGHAPAAVSKNRLLNGEFWQRSGEPRAKLCNGFLMRLQVVLEQRKSMKQ